MPLDEALVLAGEITLLRKRLIEVQQELAEVNARRQTLQGEASSIQSEITQKRANFRVAAQDA